MVQKLHLELKILQPAISRFFKLRQSAIENFMHNPLSAQQRVFNEVIAGAQHSKFGKEYNFNNINTIQEFKETVPISTYESIHTYIHALLNGEKKTLWNDDITWFAKSSGTTADKSKFIPVSRQSLDEGHFKAGKDVIALYLMEYPESTMLSGKCLVVGGSHEINKLSNATAYGDLSAVVLQNMPFIGQIMRAPELSLALLPEWETKLEKIAHAVIHENITYMAGVPTWTLLLLKRVLEITGKKTIVEVWPEIELYIHGGVSFLPYRQQFMDIIGKEDMRFLETYNASEGFFAVQDDLSQPGMLLFLNHGNFYEFLPMSEIEKDSPQTLQLDEVELDTNYALVISTNSGLFRYMVGDTIKFTSLAPYRIIITGRTKHFINAFGEEVIVDNTDKALHNTCKKTGAEVLDYTAAPAFLQNDGVGYHEWIIEFQKMPKNLDTFAEILDDELQKVNSDYQAKREQNIALKPLKVHAIKPGGFNQWLKLKNKLGGQHKVPRLSNDRKYIDEIIKVLNLSEE